MPTKLDFATKATLKQPVGGLIVEDKLEQDHVLGATGPEFDVLVPDGQWENYAPVHELQRNRFGDTYMCVTFSLNNIHEFLLNRRYDETFNFSDLFLGILSGTVRGQGNSKRAVAEARRTGGYVLEGDYPYTPETTLDEAYKPLTKALLEKGLQGLDLLTSWYKWVGDNSATSLKSALRFSPVQVDVPNSYKMNSAGMVVWNPANATYAHEVAIFGYEEGKCWYVFDSETQQYLKFDWKYYFGSPMIHAVKKNMKIQILKKKGHSALAVKTFGEPSLIFFSGGSVVGEALFKSIYGVNSFKEIPILEVDEWPFPPRHILNCTPYRGE